MPRRALTAVSWSAPGTAASRLRSTWAVNFHRSQINLFSSQVSHIAPRLRGRFSKERRLRAAWEMLARHRPERLITHRFAIDDAARAYALLDQQPQTAVQVLIDYQS